MPFVPEENHPACCMLPHPPYSPDLAPCDFALFHKLKMKLEGRRFETVSDIQRNRKRYSTALRKMTSTVLLKCGKNDGIAAYVPKETIVKEFQWMHPVVFIYFFIKSMKTQHK
jgi:hypothetical protein